jgi:protein-glutamine gamma-glutamyltransferase
VLVEGPGLVVFDACYGPGAGIDAPANYKPEEDLAVSPREAPALDQVISDLQLSSRSQEEAMRTISGFFRDNFKYSLWQEFGKAGNANETPLGRFLLRSRRGHCEYFATATVLLLRELGFPARYAVGYAVHEGGGGKYVVRQRDAHAWCQVWDPAESLWRDFDTTPPSWTEVEGQRASPMQFLSDLWSRIVFELSKFRWGQSELRQYLLWTMAPILGLLLYQIIFRRRRRRQRPEPHPLAIVWPGLDSEFYQLEQKLIERGLTRQRSEPLSEWLRRAATDPALAELQEAFGQLLHLHYRYRFDPQGLSKTDRDRLRREAQLCVAGMERPKGISREGVSLTAS